MIRSFFLGGELDAWQWRIGVGYTSGILLAFRRAHFHTLGKSCMCDWYSRLDYVFLISNNSMIAPVLTHNVDLKTPPNAVAIENTNVLIDCRPRPVWHAKAVRVTSRMLPAPSSPSDMIFLIASIYSPLSPERGTSPEHPSRSSISSIFRSSASMKIMTSSYVAASLTSPAFCGGSSIKFGTSSTIKLGVPSVIPLNPSNSASSPSASNSASSSASSTSSGMS